jgi:uncharacterized membrane protein
MGNRNMAVKNVKAQGQRTEYAIQSHFAEVSVAKPAGRILRGKVIFVKGRAVLSEGRMVPFSNDVKIVQPREVTPAKPAPVKVAFRKGYSWNK